MEYLEQLGKRAKDASRILGRLSQPDKNKGLLAAAKALKENSDILLEANEQDIVRARENNMKERVKAVSSRNICKKNVNTTAK